MATPSGLVTGNETIIVFYFKSNFRQYDLLFINSIVKTTALVLGKTEQEVRIMYADNFKKLLAN